MLTLLPMTNTLLEPYATWLADHDLTSNTIMQRRNFLRRAEDEFDLLTVTTGELSLWLAEYEGWTRRAYLSGFRSIGAFLVATGRRADNPALGLRRNPAPDVRPHPLDTRDVGMLLARASGVERAWYLLGLRAGLRAHEAAKIAGEHISRDRIRVRGKGGKVDELPTHPDLWALAQEYPRRGLWFPARGAQGHVTSRWVSKRATRALAAIGSDGSFHRLRATYGTDLLRAGVNIKVVQRLMRHHSLASTEHYLGVAESELETAIAALGRPPSLGVSTFDVGRRAA